METALANTAPGFRATIRRLEKVTGKAASWIFKLWRDYSEKCRGADQSAVMGEFVEWYAKDLARPVDVLRLAIAEPELTPLGTVKRNREHDGVEIAFTDKPDDSLRYRLKSAGFRITRRPPWRWYRKFSESAWQAACELAGVKDEGVSSTQTPVGDIGDMDVAHENETFDQQAAAIAA